jgi:7-keto-8-aminopelargonate synthetase-like enzyme
MSWLEGAQLSRAHISYFRHNDPDHLRSVLSRVESGKVRTLVCTEGVFSADGDMGRVADITEVAHAQGALVLVDEAHSMLVAGPTGRGVAEAQGVLDQIDFIVITFSKAFGGVGGALVAKQEVIQYVNWYAKCRFFSCALDPAVTGGIDKALELAMGPDGQERRQRLWDNAASMRSRLRSQVVIGESESWVIPVMYGSERLTTPINRALHQRGLDTSIMQFPAVNKGEARIRLFVTSEHSRDQIDHAVDILTDVAREFAFTR